MRCVAGTTESDCTIPRTISLEKEGPLSHPKRVARHESLWMLCYLLPTSNDENVGDCELLSVMQEQEGNGMGLSILCERLIGTQIG